MLTVDKDFLYIALATASKQLRLVRVSINWGLPPADQKLPPGGHPLSPTMHAKYLVTSSWMPTGPSITPTDSSMTQLSHVEILPSQVETMGQGQRWAPIKVLVVRSYVPTPNSPYQEPQSIIDTWELTEQSKPTLHPAFEQMGTRRDASPGPPDSVSEVCGMAFPARRC